MKTKYTAKILCDVNFKLESNNIFDAEETIDKVIQQIIDCDSIVNVPKITVELVSEFEDQKVKFKVIPKKKSIKKGI